jgi:hypothetical protein
MICMPATTNPDWTGNCPAPRSLTVCSCTSTVPHPFTFFLAKGWETADHKVRNHTVKDLGESDDFSDFLS